MNVSPASSPCAIAGWRAVTPPCARVRRTPSSNRAARAIRGRHHRASLRAAFSAPPPHSSIRLRVPSLGLHSAVATGLRPRPHAPGARESSATKAAPGPPTSRHRTRRARRPARTRAKTLGGPIGFRRWLVSAGVFAPPATANRRRTFAAARCAVPAASSPAPAAAPPRQLSAPPIFHGARRRTAPFLPPPAANAISFPAPSPVAPPPATRLTRGTRTCGATAAARALRRDRPPERRDRPARAAARAAAPRPPCAARCRARFPLRALPCASASASSDPPCRCSTSPSSPTRGKT